MGTILEAGEPGFDERPVAPGLMPSLARQGELIEAPVVPRPTVDDDDRFPPTALEDLFEK
jgi:hypothetical protein